MATQNHNFYRIRNHNHYHNHSVLTFYKLLRLLKYILQLKTSHSQLLQGAKLRTNDTVCNSKLYFKKWILIVIGLLMMMMMIQDIELYRKPLKNPETTHVFKAWGVRGTTCLRKKLMMVMLLLIMMIQRTLRSKCFVTFPVSGLAWRTCPIKPESRWWARRRSNHKRFCLWNRPAKKRTETPARWQFVCGLSQWICTVFVSTNRRRIQQNT